MPAPLCSTKPDKPKSKHISYLLARKRKGRKQGRNLFQVPTIRGPPQKGKPSCWQTTINLQIQAQNARFPPSPHSASWLILSTLGTPSLPEKCGREGAPSISCVCFLGALAFLVVSFKTAKKNTQHRHPATGGEMAFCRPKSGSCRASVRKVLRSVLPKLGFWCSIRLRHKGAPDMSKKSCNNLRMFCRCPGKLTHGDTRNIWPDSGLTS